MMLFRQRLVLANCDGAQYDPRAVPNAEAVFARQIKTALLSGNGVVINIAYFANEYRKAMIVAFEDRRFIDRCQEIFAATNPGTDQPLVLVRSDTGKLDLVDYFDSRPEDWRPSAFAATTKGDLSASELDTYRSDLEHSTRLLKSVGATAVMMRNVAKGRLTRHVKNSTNILRTQNRRDSFVHVDCGGNKHERLSLTYDTLDDIVVKAPFRSVAMRMIEQEIDYNAREFLKKGANESHLKRQKAALRAQILFDFVDPGYNAMFTDEGEALVNGNFDFVSAGVAELVGRVRQLNVRAEEFLDVMKRDHPAIASLLPQIPEMTARLRLVIGLLSPGDLPHLLMEYAIKKTLEKRKLSIARLAWSGFQAYFRDQVMLEAFSPAWDNAAAADIRLGLLRQLDPEDLPEWLGWAEETGSAASEYLDLG
jgi:hypothetical protein